MISPVEQLKGAADPTRLRILALLVQWGEALCVCQIQGALGESQSKVSRHLKELRRTGWVREERHGRWVHYALLPSASPFHHQLIGAIDKLSSDFIGLTVPLEKIETLKKQYPCQEVSDE